MGPAHHILPVRTQALVPGVTRTGRQRVTPGVSWERVTVCVVPGNPGYAGAASVVYPNLSAARSLADDVRHDARIDGGC
ncbi:MAG TPA: hypothetical protein VGP44_02225 [Gemmatimonadales bacterium]|nr:hypothetical protein [Gemmatimonadales bacterium]